MTLTRILSGIVYQPWATINLPTKLEVCISTYYKDMKGDIK